MAYLISAAVSFLTVGCLVMGAAGSAAILQLDTPRYGISHSQSHSSLIHNPSIVCLPQAEHRELHSRAVLFIWTYEVGV